MKNRTLVLVTYQFPWLPGEYFIETEIGYLAGKFSKVIIVPIRLAWMFGGLKQGRRSIAATNVMIEPGFNRLMHFFCLLRAIAEAPFLVARYRSAWSGHQEVPDSSLVTWLRSAIKVSLAKAAIRRVSSHHGTDAIYYSYWGLEAASALATFKEARKIDNLFCRCHRGDLYLDYRYPFEDLIHQQSTGLFPVSDDGADFLMRRKGFPQRNITVQRLGVHLPPAVSTHSTDGILRIVSCSNLIAVKRVHLIAEYIARSPRRIEWVHFGEGEERARVEGIISGFDGNKTAKLMGRVPNSAIHRYYEEHPVDAFINLSESEGVPVSIMEALAFGIPVIATSVGGTAELVDDSCGYLMDMDCRFDAYLEGITCLTGSNLLDLRAGARRRAELMCDARSNYEGTCDLMSRMAE